MNNLRKPFNFGCENENWLPYLFRIPHSAQTHFYYSTE